jgi:hypothetical protein
MNDKAKSEALLENFRRPQLYENLELRIELPDNLVLLATSLIMDQNELTSLDRKLVQPNDNDSHKVKASFRVYKGMVITATAFHNHRDFTFDKTGFDFSLYYEYLKNEPHIRNESLVFSNLVKEFFSSPHSFPKLDVSDIKYGWFIGMYQVLDQIRPPTF